MREARHKRRHAAQILITSMNLEKRKISSGKPISGCLGPGVGGTRTDRRKKGTGRLWIDENFLYFVAVVTQIYTFVELIKCMGKKCFQVIFSKRLCIN